MCSNDLYLEQKGLQVCFFVLHIPKKKKKKVQDTKRYNFLTLNQDTSRVSGKSPKEKFSNILFSVHVKCTNEMQNLLSSVKRTSDH